MKYTDLKTTYIYYALGVWDLRGYIPLFFFSVLNTSRVFLRFSGSIVSEEEKVPTTVEVSAKDSY